MIQRLLFISILLVVTKTQAQTLERTVVATAGGPINNTEVNLNFTIGEPIVGQVTGIAYSLDQGFWAGYLVLEPLTENPMGEIEIFPIPVKDELTIVPNGNELIGIQVFDLSGKLLLNTINTNNATQIQLPLEHLSNGVYVLQVFIKGSFPRAYKLIKE